jgi:hypothetical protein
VCCSAGLQLLAGFYISAAFELQHTSALILILLCWAYWGLFFVCATLNAPQWLPTKREFWEFWLFWY